VLQYGDTTLKTGEFYDEYTFEGRKGELVVIDLYSDHFDPYLIVVPPEGEQAENDDLDGQKNRSQVVLTLATTGTYKVWATTYKRSEKGAYRLTMANRDAMAVASASGDKSLSGRLVQGDATLKSGEFVDTHTFEGIPGQRVRVTLSTSQFDPYLIIQPPHGDQLDNDDFGDQKDKSQLELDITEAGTYKILVTTYKTGDKGSYNLQIETVDASVARAREAANPANNANNTKPSNTPNTARDERRDVTTLTYGKDVNGRLASNDNRLDTGESVDYFVFEGREGDIVVIDLTSTAFDPYLILTLPNNSIVNNDDFEGSNQRSKIEMRLPETGRYRIAVTAYAADQFGLYKLRLTKAETLSPEIIAQNARNNRGGTVYGIFMGISNYGGRMGNLEYTAQDATLVRNALMQGAGMAQENAIVLTDRQATVANLRSAIQTMAAKVTPNDVFVLFYSGHGDRYDRTTPQMSDPDGKDESIELYDKELKDDDMSALLDQINAKTELLVLDSCFSGGFAKDVISKPHRMGMFSSEEDVTSNVADKFKAGGFLSSFFASGIGEGRADEDRDGKITALELSQYIYERFRSEVKSGGSDGNDIVFASRNLGYQKLVVDRGSIGPYDTLFTKRR
jgi:hypothetical protein